MSVAEDTAATEGNVRLLKPGRQSKHKKKPKWTDVRRKKYAATMRAKKNGEPLPGTDKVAALRAEGLSVYQIAKSLKMSENSVYTRIHRLEEAEPKKPKPRTVSIPLHAVPARANGAVRIDAPRAPMRVAIKAGSEVTVTIGGVEVQIVAEER